MANIHQFDPQRLASNPENPDGKSPEPGELDRRMLEVLIHLPREKAGDSFTANVLDQTVLARGSEVNMGFTRNRRLRSLAAAAAFCAASAFGAHQWSESLAREAEAHRVASLQVEYEQLQKELLDLQRTAQKQRPVVYLGGQGDVEYVVDLSRLPRNQPVARNARQDIRPASAAVF